MAENSRRNRWLYCTRRSFAVCKAKLPTISLQICHMDARETARSVNFKRFWRLCCMFHLLSAFPDSIYWIPKATHVWRHICFRPRLRSVGRHLLRPVLFKQLFCQWIKFSQKRSNVMHCHTFRRINILHVRGSKKTEVELGVVIRRRYS